MPWQCWYESKMSLRAGGVAIPRDQWAPRVPYDCKKEKKLETLQMILKLFVKKFTSRKLWFAFAAIVWAYLSQNYEVMSTIVIGYLAVQAVDDVIGEIKGLTEDLNFWLEKLLSRKFWIGVLGLLLAYQIQDFEIMRNIVVAYLTAEGFTDAVPLVQGTDFSTIFKKKVSANNAVTAAATTSNGLPILSNAGGEVSPKEGDEGYTPPSKESDNYPQPAPEVKTVYTFTPFDEAEWDHSVKERAQSQFNATDIWLQILALPSAADEKTVRFTKNVIAFGSYYLEKAKEAFKNKFGFAYEDRNNPESLAMLLDKCGKVPVSFITFIATTSQDQSYQTIYETVKSVSDQFAMVEKAMEKEAAYDAKLQEYASGYSYHQAFWRLNEFAV